MQRLSRASIATLAAIVAAVAGIIAYVLNDAPSETAVRLRVQEQAAARIASEIESIEAVAFQFIANQDLNDSLHAYATRAHRYDVALYNLTFTRHLESQSASVPLLDEAFFLDYDESGRIPLTMTEDFLRPEIRAARDFVWDRAVAADGMCAWMDGTLTVHGRRYIAAARLIKRLKTGEPIGVLALLIDSRRTAESIEAMAGTGGARRIGLLVSPGGEVLASTEAGEAGLPVSEAIGDSSYFRTIMSQGQVSGQFYAARGGKRAAALFTLVRPNGPYLISVYPDWRDFGRLRRFLIAAIVAAAAGAAVALGARGSRGSAAFGEEAAELPEGLPPLSDKEARLLRMLSRGMSNKEIAYEFGVKEQTVKNYLGPLYEKLGVHDRVSALLKLRSGKPGNGST